MEDGMLVLTLLCLFSVGIALGLVIAFGIMHEIERRKK
jgi:hypothetical protein